ncbi:hypothetical protein AAEU28_16090 [Pseudoalteromonas sp. SS15]|uniref:hypothetical protein n=1 Tax=Pseudoalteromonas sp. SS15 TaxID=3139393 RepID=UPI003BABFAFE
MSLEKEVDYNIAHLKKSLKSVSLGYSENEHEVLFNNLKSSIEAYFAKTSEPNREKVESWLSSVSELETVAARLKLESVKLIEKRKQGKLGVNKYLSHSK